MKLLTLTTAEQGAGMALFQDQSLVVHSYWASDLTHSQRLISMIQDMVIHKAGWELEQIDGFVAARGPGSFTGLRIGISVVKGLAAGLSKPQAGVSSLDGIAWQFAFSDLPVVVMMDARKSEVYTCMYQFSKGSLVEKTPETVASPGTAVEAALAYTKGRHFLAAGAGARVYESIIQDMAQDQVCFCPSSMNSVSAACLAIPVFQEPDFFNNPENRLFPSYIRTGY